MVKYFVRTTGTRILGDSYNQIDFELLVDTEHNARKSFVEQLEYLATLDCDIVLLEDDLILCKDFKNRIEEVIKEYKDYIVNFFYNPGYYFSTHLSESFNWNQCVYYPKKVLKLLSKEMRHQYTLYPEVQHDIVEGRALSLLRIPNIIYRPCLVQHLDKDSLIQGHTDGRRRTPYFIDYLDELGISYDEAYKYKDELVKLMNKKFENYKKEMEYFVRDSYRTINDIKEERK